MEGLAWQSCIRLLKEVWKGHFARSIWGRPCWFTWATRSGPTWISAFGRGRSKPAVAYITEIRRSPAALYVIDCDVYYKMLNNIKKNTLQINSIKIEKKHKSALIKYVVGVPADHIV